MLDIPMMEKRIKNMQKRYLRHVKSGERKKKREQDVHLTPKDERILVETIVLSNLISHGIRRFFAVT